MLEIIRQEEVFGKEFKIYGTYEEPLFLAKDVAEWIEHGSVSRMLDKVDEDEKGMNINHTLGGNQEMWFLTEDGLYEVLLQSRKPIAKEFKKEVKKILKAIRKNELPVQTSRTKFVNDPQTLEHLVDLLEIEQNKTSFLIGENAVLTSNNAVLNQAVRNYTKQLEEYKDLDKKVAFAETVLRLQRVYGF